MWDVGKMEKPEKGCKNQKYCLLPVDEEKPVLENVKSAGGPKPLVWIFIACAAFAALFVLLSFKANITTTKIDAKDPHNDLFAAPCYDDGNCSFTLVESIPENLTYPDGSPSHLSTHEAWMQLINSANRSIHIAAYYWSLRASDENYTDPSDWQGRSILEGLITAAKDRKIEVRIVNNYESVVDPDTMSLILAGAEVRMINFDKLLNGGILHTKMWVVDDRHVYVGSANMDWRSLTQVKELGAFITNCSCIAADAAKLFNIYWYLGIPDIPIPPTWPAAWDTLYNANTPMNVQLDQTNSLFYLSSAPPPFCTPGRTDDIDAILDVIHKAKKFIYISVMDYQPEMIYVTPQQFWPVIDDALRQVTLEKGIKVRLLISLWNHTHPTMIRFLHSLADINKAMNADIEVKMFYIPAYTPIQQQMPYARVNHNKYMVTDTVAYIGTSNWSGDYFVTTAGVGLVVNQTEAQCSKQVSHLDNDSSGLSCLTTIQQQMAAIFDRDWNSTYTRPLPDLD